MVDDTATGALLASVKPVTSLYMKRFLSLPVEACSLLRPKLSRLPVHMPVCVGQVLTPPFQSAGQLCLNVGGVSTAAGGRFTYFDFVSSRSQPFIGGTMSGDSKVEHRFNINFSDYF